jgi:hypothetical protein
VDVLRAIAFIQNALWYDVPDDFTLAKVAVVEKFEVRPGV